MAERSDTEASEVEPWGEWFAPSRPSSVAETPAEPAEEDGTAIFAAAMAVHGRRTYLPGDDIYCQEERCALCTSLPEYFPCPTTEHHGYPTPEVVRQEGSETTRTTSVDAELTLEQEKVLNAQATAIMKSGQDVRWSVEAQVLIQAGWRPFGWASPAVEGTTPPPCSCGMATSALAAELMPPCARHGSGVPAHPGVARLLALCAEIESRNPEIPQTLDVDEIRALLAGGDR